MCCLRGERGLRLSSSATSRSSPSGTRAARNWQKCGSVLHAMILVLARRPQGVLAATMLLTTQPDSISSELKSVYHAVRPLRCCPDFVVELAIHEEIVVAPRFPGKISVEGAPQLTKLCEKPEVRQNTILRAE